MSQINQANTQWCRLGSHPLYNPDNKVHGANMGHLGPVGPRWAPCWPHETCYQGNFLWRIDTKRHSLQIVKRKMPFFLQLQITQQMLCLYLFWYPLAESDLWNSINRGSRGKMEHGCKMEHSVFGEKYTGCGSIVVSTWVPSSVSAVWHIKINW